MTASVPRVGRVSIDLIDYHSHNVRVDLGDLRDLADSIRRFGVMQPVVLEQRGQRLRIRAGHRRVAASVMAGLSRIPAVVHGEALEDDEWLTAAVHENTRRRGLDSADRGRAAAAMRANGMTWDAIGDAFGVSPATARGYVHVDSGPTAVDELAAARAERVKELTQQGESAAQIADRLGVSPMTVHRYRTGNRAVSPARIRTFVADAREAIANGSWTTDQLLDELELLATPRKTEAAS